MFNRFFTKINLKWNLSVPYLKIVFLEIFDLGNGEKFQLDCWFQSIWVNRYFLILSILVLTDQSRNYLSGKLSFIIKSIDRDFAKGSCSDD